MSGAITLRFLAAMGRFPKTKVILKGRNIKTAYVIVQVDDYDYALKPEKASSVYLSQAGNV